MDLPGQPSVDAPPRARADAGMPRDVKFRRGNFQEPDGSFVYTLGCYGCIALAAGTPPPPHIDACRERMRQRIAETKSGRQRLSAAETRKKAYEEARTGEASLEAARDDQGDQSDPRARGDSHAHDQGDQGELHARTRVTLVTLVIPGSF